MSEFSVVIDEYRFSYSLVQEHILFGSCVKMMERCQKKTVLLDLYNFIREN